MCERIGVEGQDFLHGELAAGNRVGPFLARAVDRVGIRPAVALMYGKELALEAAPRPLEVGEDVELPPLGAARVEARDLASVVFEDRRQNAARLVDVDQAHRANRGAGRQELRSFVLEMRWRMANRNRAITEDEHILEQARIDSDYFLRPVSRGGRPGRTQMEGLPPGPVPGP